MQITAAQYEEVLAACSDYQGTIALLKQHRPYLELIPSMRRPRESLITIPLPLVRIRKLAVTDGVTLPPGEVLRLPCDLAILMCDPEWKIKTGAEVMVFVQRPQEDFSGLLSRWRHSQMVMDKGYEWLMPDRFRDILSEGADQICPLFLLFPETPERIKRGLRGAGLPFVVQQISPVADPPIANPFSVELLNVETE